VLANQALEEKNTEKHLPNWINTCDERAILTTEVIASSL